MKNKFIICKSAVNNFDIKCFNINKIVTLHNLKTSKDSITIVTTTDGVEHCIAEPINEILAKIDEKENIN